MRLMICGCFMTLLGGFGCGGKVEYSYTFAVTGCATGDKTFSSLSAMCTALESDSENNSCALAARQAFFLQKCPGTFQETN